MEVEKILAVAIIFSTVVGAAFGYVYYQYNLQQFAKTHDCQSLISTSDMKEVVCYHQTFYEIQQAIEFSKYRDDEPIVSLDDGSGEYYVSWVPYEPPKDECGIFVSHDLSAEEAAVLKGCYKYFGSNLNVKNMAYVWCCPKQK